MRRFGNRILASVCSLRGHRWVPVPGSWHHPTLGLYECDRCGVLENEPGSS